MAIPPQAQTVLLDDLQSDHDRFTALVKRLSDEEQQRPFTAEGWSVKDFLAHMTHWKRAVHAYLVAYLTTSPCRQHYPAAMKAMPHNVHLMRLVRCKKSILIGKKFTPIYGIL